MQRALKPGVYIGYLECARDPGGEGREGGVHVKSLEMLVRKF